jgi:hypothetical protein
MNPDNTEDLLTRTLHERTERTGYPATPVSTVAARARGVRARRRRTSALAVAATLAVVAVPGAVWLSRSPDSSSGPTVAPSTTPSSPTVSSGVPATLADLSFGHRPGIDYLDDDTYVGMGGGNVTDPLLRKATSVSLVRGGLLVALRSTLPDDRVGDLQLVSDQGDQGLGCGANRFAISADRVESAYWVMDSCTTGGAGKLYSGVNNTMGESGPSYVATPAGRVVQPVGFVSQGVVANLATPDHGDDQGVWVYGPQGGPTRVRGLATAGGTEQSDDLIAGQVAGDLSTGIIVHASTGAPVAYIPSWTLGQFSADGRYVLGVQRRDGEPDGYAIFDAATGDKVTEFGSTPLGEFGIRQVAWDVDDTVLAVAQDGRSSDDAIVRFDLHGHTTLATEPKPAADPSFPVFRLATRP